MSTRDRLASARAEVEAETAQRIAREVGAVREESERKLAAAAEHETAALERLRAELSEEEKEHRRTADKLAREMESQGKTKAQRLEMEDSAAPLLMTNKASP